MTNSGRSELQIAEPERGTAHEKGLAISYRRVTCASYVSICRRLTQASSSDDGADLQLDRILSRCQRRRCMGERHVDRQSYGSEFLRRPLWSDRRWYGGLQLAALAPLCCRY